MDFSKETSGKGGKRRSPVPKHNSKAPEQSERALSPAAPSITGRGQLEPNWFWAMASGSGPLLLPAEAGAAIPPFASTAERVAASAAPEKQAAKIFWVKSREMVPAHVWWDPTRPSLPGLGSSFISCHPSQNFGACPPQSSHSPAIPCDRAGSWRLCRRWTWLALCRVVSRSGHRSHCTPTGSKPLLGHG